MDKHTAKWGGQLALALVGTGVWIAVLIWLSRIAPPLLFWIFVILFVQSSLGGLVRLWMTRPGHPQDKPEASWQPPQPEAALPHCPHCGAVVAGTDWFCRGCGQSLALPKAEKEAESASHNSEGRDG